MMHTRSREAAKGHAFTPYLVTPHQVTRSPRRPLPIERQQPYQDRLIAQLRWPAVARSDSSIERRVQCRKPVGAFVRETGKRARLFRCNTRHPGWPLPGGEPRVASPGAV